MDITYQEKSAHKSDNELIFDLQETAKKLSKTTLTISEYEENGRYSASTIMRRFGTWNKALAAAGIDASNRFYSDRELFDNLADVWGQLGRQPSRRDLEKVQSPISYKAYERRFGKWSSAVRAFVDHYSISANESEGYIVSAGTSTHTTTRDINLRLRYQIMLRDHFKCCQCGASPASDPSVTLHVDHIHPWAKGGETVFENLQTLCSKCNLGKSNLI